MLSLCDCTFMTHKYKQDIKQSFSSFEIPLEFGCIAPFNNVLVLQAMWRPNVCASRINSQILCVSVKSLSVRYPSIHTGPGVCVQAWNPCKAMTSTLPKLSTRRSYIHTIFGCVVSDKRVGYLVHVDFAVKLESFCRGPLPEPVVSKRVRPDPSV